MRNNTYVAHTCKNSKLPPSHPDYCDRIWIDIDKTGATTHCPTWKYCKECETKGFKNPKTRQVTRTPEQIEEFKRRMAEYREKRKNDLSSL